VLARWTVRYGPEFARSKSTCHVSPQRLDLSLKAIELSLERDPFRFSQAFADDAHRVIQTKDDFEDGFILTAFVVLYTKRVAEIKWIETHPLPNGNNEPT
jgi:hypothetical protein